MTDAWAAGVCALAMWAIVIGSAYFGPVRRPAGEAWVVTASEKMADRPTLVRANIPYQAAALQ
jgi:hypothetical protein